MLRQHAHVLRGGLRRPKAQVLYKLGNGVQLNSIISARPLCPGGLKNHHGMAILNFARGIVG